jgi:hypothetical protein
MTRRIVCSLAALALVALSAGAGETLPKAEAVLDKYVEASGGKEAFLKLKNRVGKGKFSAPVAGIEGDVTIAQAAPDKLHVTLNLPGAGKIEEGVSDGVAWEKSVLTGTKIKKGNAKASALRNADFYSELNWRKLYKKAETTGEAQVDGKPAYKVDLTTPEGKVVTGYYDKKSGLLVKKTLEVETDQGDIKSDIYLTDYKKVDGIMVPHKAKHEGGPLVINIELTSIEHNVDIPAERFALPPDVRKLLAKQKSK